MLPERVRACKHPRHHLPFTLVISDATCSYVSNPSQLSYPAAFASQARHCKRDTAEGMLDGAEELLSVTEAPLNMIHLAHYSDLAH